MKCANMSIDEYKKLYVCDEEWVCCLCELPPLSDSFFAYGVMQVGEI